MEFKMLDRLEGKKIDLDDLPLAVSFKHLWLEMILNGALVSRLFSDERYVAAIAKAVAWYCAFESELNDHGIFNKEIDRLVEDKRIQPYRIKFEEFRVDLSRFRKMVYYEGFIQPTDGSAPKI